MFKVGTLSAAMEEEQYDGEPDGDDEIHEIAKRVDVDRPRPYQWSEMNSQMWAETVLDRLWENKMIWPNSLFTPFDSSAQDVRRAAITAELETSWPKWIEQRGKSKTGWTVVELPE